MEIPQPENPAAPVMKRKIGVWIVVTSCLGILLCLLSCSGIGLFGMYRQLSERKSIRTALETYVQSVADGDFNTAYLLLTTTVRQKIPLPEFRRNIEENEYFYYHGYRRLMITGLQSDTAFFSSKTEKTSQKTTATLTGSFIYEDNTSCKFEAILEKVKGVWNISEVEFFPPEKSNTISMELPANLSVG